MVTDDKTARTHRYGPARPMNKDYPPARFATEGEYHAAAGLLDMWYDIQDHTFNPHKLDRGVGSPSRMLCPDTLEPVSDGRLRRIHVNQYCLGPQDWIDRK